MLPTLRLSYSSDNNYATKATFVLASDNNYATKATFVLAQTIIMRPTLRLSVLA